MENYFVHAPQSRGKQVCVSNLGVMTESWTEVKAGIVQ